MKRAGNLFPKILEWENLRLALWKALRGKRDRLDAREFQAEAEARLGELGDRLRRGTVVVGRYHQFVIHDPKERVITAPCFEERVLHHAIMNVCEPVFDRRLIDDTFACRVGKGRLAALARAQSFARRAPYYLKIDVRKYFDSIDHERLIHRLEGLFKDREVSRLLGKIVRSYQVGPSSRGLPIGSLTSQHLANFYLGFHDRFVKECLRIPGYVRYMDDMAIWGDSTAELREVLGRSRQFLGEELGLGLKANVAINRTVLGMDFLGARVFPTHLTLSRASRVRFRRKLRLLVRLHAEGRISDRELLQRVTSLVAFTRAGGVASWRFRSRVIDSAWGAGQGARTG